MTPSDALEQKMYHRATLYAARALALRYDYPDTTIPAAVIEGLLMDAYCDGGRDMYALCDEAMAPLWERLDDK